jgi:hypothetical protein
MKMVLVEAERKSRSNQHQVSSIYFILTFADHSGLHNKLEKTKIRAY